MALGIALDFEQPKGVQLKQACQVDATAADHFELIIVDHDTIAAIARNLAKGIPQ